MRKILYDVTLRKIGCVLLQASTGGDTRAPQDFPTEDWFLAPTPNMRLYETSESQYEALKEMHKHPLPNREPAYGTHREKALTCAT